MAILSSITTTTSSYISTVSIFSHIANPPTITILPPPPPLCTTAMADPQATMRTTTAGDQAHRLQSIEVKTSSPRFPLSPSPTLSTANRRVGIAVDLSDESAFAVAWAVENYIRPGDVVILIHVNSTSGLYGADWGSGGGNNGEFENFTSTTLANRIAQPLVDAAVPFKIRIVKDHDMKERLCLEIERLGLSAVVMGGRGIGGSRCGKGRLGSVSDYCLQHSACPVVVVRYKREEKVVEEEESEEEEMQEFHDANDCQLK